MLRIKGVTNEDAPEEVRRAFEEQEKQYGAVLNTARVYGLRPTIQKGVQALQQGIVASGLIPADLRHLPTRHSRSPTLRQSRTSDFS